MAQVSLITQAMRSAVGVEGEAVVNEVEKGAIVKFAEAIGDSNPIYTNEAVARKSQYGGIIAPPTFLRSMKGTVIPLEPEMPLHRRVDGGSDWEYFEPVRSGDRIVVTPKLKEIYERDGRLGRMVFLIKEIRYTNQLGEVVALQRSTLIYY